MIVGDDSLGKLHEIKFVCAKVTAFQSHAFYNSAFIKCDLSANVVCSFCFKNCDFPVKGTGVLTGRHLAKHANNGIEFYVKVV